MTENLAIFPMYRPPKSHAQTSLFCSLEEQLNHKHPLYVLANKIDWNKFETEFSKRFDDKMGAPNKPIRLMTGFIILKHIRDVSDESVVEQFQENAYYQYFCGERIFTTEQPCDPSELVHFRLPQTENHRGSARPRNGTESFEEKSVGYVQRKN